MKNLKKIILSVVAFMILVVPAVLMGCGNDPIEATLEILQEFKTEYYVGEELDVSGGILKYTEEGKTPEYIEIEDDMVSFFYNETAGDKTLVIEYKEESVEVDYKVIEPTRIENKQVYYMFDNQASGENLYLFYYDQDLSVWYEGTVLYNEFTTLSDAVENFLAAPKTNPLFVTEELQNGKIVLSGVHEVEDESEPFTVSYVVIPAADGQSFDLQTTWGGNTVTGTFILYNEAEYNAMPRVADKTVYCGSASAESPYYTLIYVDYSETKLYLQTVNTTEANSIVDATEMFDKSTAQVKEFVEKIENGVKKVYVYVEVGTQKQTLIVSPNEDGKTAELKMIFGTTESETTQTMTMKTYTVEAYEELVAVADKQVYCTLDPESGAYYSLMYFDFEEGKMYISSVDTENASSAEEAASMFDKSTAQATSFVEIVDNGKRILTISISGGIMLQTGVVTPSADGQSAVCVLTMTNTETNESDVITYNFTLYPQA